MSLKTLRYVFLAVLAFLVIGGLFSTTSGASSQSPVYSRLASISDFFKNLTWPNLTSPQTAPVPQYKPVADYENAVINAVKKVSPAVVSITISKNLPVYGGDCAPTNPFANLPPEIQQFFGGGLGQPCVPTQSGSKLTEVGGGSGFIISADGLIVTNKHVVSDSSATYTVYTNDGKKYSARVLARDPIQDLAVVKIDATGLPTVNLGDSDSLQLGQSAVAIGNALGEFQNTVSVGVISGLKRSITALDDSGQAENIQGVLQTDAAINPGNSGGPLINLAGDVVGINVAIVSGAQNIGFALPVNWAKHDIQTVMSGGKLQAPYMGVRYQVVTPDLAQTKHLDVDYGALVSSVSGQPGVVKGSPADKAGLKDGDIILSLDGQSLRDGDLLQLIAQKSVGDTVNLDVFRGKSTIRVSVTLSARP